MSDLDDLRRVAYGRTTSAAEEAAAADARAALERHDTAARAERSAREADEFTRARAVDRDRAAGSDTGQTAPIDQSIALTIVDVYGEPGYLRRLAASWRVWAVPAFAAFVIGISITAASGLIILQASRTGPAEVVTSGEQVGAPAATPGDLAYASDLLAREQKPEDILPDIVSSADESTSHLLRAGTPTSVFAAMSDDGEICLFVIWEVSGAAGGTCTPPSQFALQGLMIGSSSDGQTAQVQWDGRTLTETAATP